MKAPNRDAFKLSALKRDLYPWGRRSHPLPLPPIPVDRIYVKRERDKFHFKRECFSFILFNLDLAGQFFLVALNGFGGNKICCFRAKRESLKVFEVVCGRMRKTFLDE